MTFGIFQARFAIVRGPARFWDQEVLWYIMNACVIMHNMIIENERGKNLVSTHFPCMCIGGNIEWHVSSFVPCHSGQ
jgi:hypothetical protein